MAFHPAREAVYHQGEKAVLGLRELIMVLLLILIINNNVYEHLFISWPKGKVCPEDIHHLINLTVKPQSRK